MKLKSLLFSLILLSIAGWGPIQTDLLSSIFSNSHSTSGSSWIDKATVAIRAQAGNLSPEVLKVGLTAYLKARERGLDQKQVLTLVDYSKPSNERRLWVIDLKNLKVLFNTWVAHGKNSGSVNATSFSNTPGSLKSSFGVFVTDESYMGGKGYSLRVKGLEKQVNSNAFNRNIVVHGAWYVGEDVIKNNGRLGRSFGCFAVSQEVIKPLINTIKDKTLIVAYYNDKNWLKTSDFVGSSHTSSLI